MRVTRPPVLISLALIVIGAVLLFRNFLLIDNAALTRRAGGRGY